MPPRNLAGMTFGFWTVDCLSSSHPVKGRIWQCHCACGTVRDVPGGSLTRSKKPSRSCGCNSKELNAVANTKHGRSRTVEYHIYQQMLQRCFNKKCSAFEHYGGRGIIVHSRWLGPRGFEHFFADMGQKPDGHSLERKKNNQSYSPKNCYWATRRDQNNNTRRNRQLRHLGKTQTMMQWSVESGINYSTIRKRLRLGWPVAEALTR